MEPFLIPAPIPGVDESCNAMYLSLVGEMPEQYCPPGCTLQANARGTIFVIDHIRRIGFPLQLTAPPAAAAPTRISAAVMPGTVAPASVSQPLPVAQHSFPSSAPPQSDVTVGTAQLDVQAPRPQQQQQCQQPSEQEFIEGVSPEPFIQSPPALADPTMAEEQVPPPPRAPAHKRSRTDSPSSQVAPLSHTQLHQRQDSQEASTGPTALADEYALTPSNRSTASLPRQGWAAVEEDPMRRLSMSADVMKSPRFCLIMPRKHWFEDIFFALNMSHRWPPGPGLFFYCHYCRVYFHPNPQSMHRHLSSDKPHKVQRQRVRGYLVSKVGRQLLDTPLKRRFRVLTLEELQSIPDHLFPGVSKILLGHGMAALPDCLEPRSLITSTQRDRIVRDGAPIAEASPESDDLAPFTTGKLEDEPAELIGWRFIMHGLDVVKAYCKTCEVPLCAKNILKHERDSQHRDHKERNSSYPSHKRAKDDR